MTYTYAVLDVPRAVYAAVRALLDAASYQHAFHHEKDDEGFPVEVIDMHQEHWLLGGIGRRGADGFSRATTGQSGGRISHVTGGQMATQKQLEIYQQRDGRFRYRLLSAHGENLSNPGQAYASRGGARRAAKREHPGTPIAAAK